ncbi:T6SS immunity protein Tli4 family protein [Massilia sp. YIM B02443]|uniref:T6SS immunity protein Tli4 family protein n=1 Tax=Massilia sp. YIM B02443 TaxID=3050127 RepID=UPI0025B6B7BF|nr:T6SS immunity protein Tli4 family protein [Massilia sp. YIM B02443]MDN4035489.1 T6SS immunity protein Tli4 family protein [Massilia sp. YIM B02443]
MNQKNESGTRFVGIVALVLGLSIVYAWGNNVMDRFKVARLTDPMRPVCVGRYVIDLPDKMKVTYRSVFLNGFWISNRRESESAFHARVAQREAQINAEQNTSGLASMEKVSTVDTNGFTGKTFIFGRKFGYYFEGPLRVDYSNVAAEAYVHSQGISFNIITDGYDPDQVHGIHEVIARLRLIEPGTLPTTPGFCLGPAMFIDPIPADWTEGVGVYAGFPEHPDLALSFYTRAGLINTNGDPGRLARHQRVYDEMPLWRKALTRRIRLGARAINGVQGEEVIQVKGGAGHTHVYFFDWERLADPQDVMQPQMHLEISTGHRRDGRRKPAPSFLGEPALLDLWHTISSSVRVRPTAAPASAP